MSVGKSSTFSIRESWVAVSEKPAISGQLLSTNVAIPSKNNVHSPAVQGPDKSKSNSGGDSSNHALSPFGHSAEQLDVPVVLGNPVLTNHRPGDRLGLTLRLVLGELRFLAVRGLPY